ncbi:hypothetical protein Slin14017_G093230 [Septoria linicola]|nr:hypothetical protein Slin14017_G093230 [Septoria linicola]
MKRIRDQRRNDKEARLTRHEKKDLEAPHILCGIDKHMNEDDEEVIYKLEQSLESSILRTAAPKQKNSLHASKNVKPAGRHDAPLTWPARTQPKRSSKPRSLRNYNYGDDPSVIYDSDYADEGEGEGESTDDDMEDCNMEAATETKNKEQGKYRLCSNSPDRKKTKAEVNLELKQIEIERKQLDVRALKAQKELMALEYRR